MLALKLSQSGSRLRHELASYLLHVRPSVRPRMARGGRIRLGSGRNEAGRRRGRQKPWKTLNSEIPVWRPCNLLKSHRTAKAFLGPQRLHAVECERSLIGPQPGARPAEGTRKLPGCKALKSHKTAKALQACGNGPPPRPVRTGRGRAVTSRPAPGSRARRCRA
jgi:hypothetical protein